MHELEQRLTEAEQLLQKLYGNLWLSTRKERSNKMKDRYTLRRKLGLEKPYGDDWQRSGLKQLRLSLDKLQMANNSSRGKCLKLCSSVKEVNHHSLHFGLLHGIKNLSIEKKILQKLKNVEKEPSAQYQGDNYQNTTYTVYYICEAVKNPKQQNDEEGEIQSCAVNGNKWKSLGTKQYILQEIKSLCEQFGNEDDPILLKKNLAAVKSEILCIYNEHDDFCQMKDEANICISHLRKQNHMIKAKETRLLNKFHKCNEGKTILFEQHYQSF